MAWKKRSSSSPKVPSYGENGEYFTILLHHHGTFSWNRLAYVGGIVDYFDFCSSDEMSMLEIKEMASLCGVDNHLTSFYYSKSGVSYCRDIVLLERDIDVLDLANFVDENKSVSVFVDHVNDKDEYLMDEEEMSKVTEGLDYLGDDDDDGISDANENADENFSETEVEDNCVVDNMEQCLFDCLVDEKDMYKVDEEQSMGSDSVHSEDMVDSECELSTENAAFYADVRVETNFGGYYNTSFNPGPVMHVPSTSHGDNQSPKTYAGFKLFNPKTDMEDPQFSIGLIFEGADVLRNAIRSNSIKHARELNFKRNDIDRIKVECIGKGCGWSITAASFKGHKHTLQVKKFNGSHTCGREDIVKAATSTWVANKYAVELQTNEKWPVKSMTAVIQKYDKLEFKEKNKYRLYRAKKKIKEITHGNEDEQYGSLWTYAAGIMRSNGSNNVKIKSFERDDGKVLFKRMYICWGAMKKGFDAGLRKFVCLDGCHLKTKNGGILLTALGIDPNNSTYPIAHAIVEKEKTETWM